jgi:hypothetical protein
MYLHVHFHLEGRKSFITAHFTSTTHKQIKKTQQQQNKTKQKQKQKTSIGPSQNARTHKTVTQLFHFPEKSGYHFIVKICLNQNPIVFDKYQTILPSTKAKTKKPLPLTLYGDCCSSSSTQIQY